MYAAHSLRWVAAFILPPLLLTFQSTANQLHSGHSLELTHSTSISDSSQIVSPLVVNCSTPVCDGPLKEIYCIGPILSAAWQFQMQNSCPGSKLKGTPQTVLENFAKLSYPLNKTSFVQFCEENFENGRYLENVSFPDWTKSPEAISKISNSKRKKLALEIHERWNVLGRKFSSEVVSNPSQYPVTPVPHPFIVPGGEFDIYFYWDSYWIIEGLLVSNMTETVRGILSNFAYLVDKQGFIPNSGKLQLSSRSQPPLFTQMVYEYYIATGDANFTRSILPTLEKELSFWEKNRQFTVAKDGTNYNVFQYKTASNCPRPENFLVDYWQGMNNTRGAENVWSSISSACESGWDFSSRWFATNGTDAFSKRSIHTTSIVPVDLNSIMAWNYKALSTLYSKCNDTNKASEFRNKFNSFSTTLTNFFWNEQEGIWLDYDIETASPRFSFYPSNLFPLLIHNPTGDVIKRVGEYLEKNSILKLPGGIPSTMPVNSTEQWDFPNVWAPTLHLFIMSLLSTRDAYLVQQAKEVADRFTSTVYQGLFEPPTGSKSGIWEKYDARRADGTFGSGGEYPVQEGFGWTNGAALHLIMMFDQSTHPTQTKEVPAKLRKLSGESSLSSMLGQFPNNLVIASLLLFCMCLSVLFVVVANHNLRRALDRRRNREGEVERDQMSRLLQEMDSDEDQ